MQVNQPQGGGAEAITIDPLYREAVKHVISNQRASITILQRRLTIGYNRASRLMQELERTGIVSTMDDNGSHDVLVREVPVPKPTTPRYDTIVIRGAKGETVPKEVDGGEVVAWSLGHGLAAMDALEEFVDDLAAGNCNQPTHLTQGAADALNLMRRRRVIGWDADEPEQLPADWKTAVARAEATARLVFGAADPDAMQAIDYMAGLLLANEPAAPSKWTHEKPTQPGAYWIRGNLLQEDALVQVKVVNGVLSCNLHQVNSDPGFDFGFTIEKLSDDFEWLGPLAPMGGR